MDSKSSLQTFSGPSGGPAGPLTRGPFGAVVQAARLLLPGVGAVLMPGARTFCSLFWGVLGILRLDLALGAYDGENMWFAAFFGGFWGAPLNPHFAGPSGHESGQRACFSRGSGLRAYFSAGGAGLVPADGSFLGPFLG